MFSQITEADLNNKGVSGLPDTPNLSTSDMQAKFDELSKDVIVPKFNNLVEELSAQSASENIGITPPEKFTGDTIKALIYEIVEIVLSNQSKSHEHSNKGILDGITDQNLLDLDNLVNLFSGISTVASVVSDSLSEIPNSHAIVEYMTQLGSGDMQKAIYDKDNSGVVDDAEKLGGLSAESYQKVLESSLQTENKTIPSAINELADSLSNMSIKQGDLSELQTSVKSSIVSAINEVLGSIPNMLSTLEEVDANTESGKVADALTLKQVNRNLGDFSGFTNDDYPSIGAFIQYCVDNGFLPDINSIPLIPIMTSDTTPSGVASASSVWNSSYHAYYAFDNNDTTLWVANTYTNSWVGYEFTEAKIANRAKIIVPSHKCKNFKIQASNDGSNWVDLYTGVNSDNIGSTKTIDVRFNNNTAYKKYRLFVIDTYGSNENYVISCQSLQLYERV